MKQCIFAVVFFLLAASNVWAQQKYDLLLKGGHVIDPKNKISAIRDVAIAGGKVVAVAANINPADAFKVVDVKGLYVTPGLIPPPASRIGTFRLVCAAGSPMSLDMNNTL